MIIGLSILLAALTLLAVCWPYYALRLVMRFVTRSVLWLRVEGTVPPGPAIILSSPLSYLGWLILLVAAPRRVRFLILAGWTSRGLPGWLLRRAGAVTMQGEDSRAVEDALARAAACLEAGEVVCVLAQGCRTSDGGEWPASRVLDTLTARKKVPIVPACLIQPTGSLFAMHGGTFVRKWPPRWPCVVEVTFGRTLPAGATAAEARQQMQELSARAAIARKPRRLPVHRQFVRTAARRPFSPCWIDSTAPGQDMNYAKAYVGSVCLSRLLRRMLGAEKMVGIWLPPGRGAALANVALALLGKTAVNLNYTTSAEGVRSSLAQCACKHVITAKRFLARMPMDFGPGIEVILLEDLLPLVSSWDKFWAFVSVLVLPGWLLDHFVLGLSGHGMDDLATVIFSSGSTGDPKGIMLTHDNIVGNVEGFTQWATLVPSDRLMGVLPFFHSFGYTVTLWGPLQLGASVVYHPDPRQAREIGDLCRDHSATVNLSTATFLRFCLRKCGPDDFKTLRILICGAEKLPPPLAAEFRDRFGILPLEGYGCTELSPVVSTNIADQPCGGVVEVFNRSGTVGAPLPGVAGRTVHPETYEWQPAGEEGILVFTGPNVMTGYLNRPDLTAGVMKDGWYITGDVGRIDAEGSITITGRMSRFAKIGGEMVPLERVEEELHEALGVAERVCAVSCVPDESRGERVVVLYLAAGLAETGHDVRWWCDALAERGLANLWIPGLRDFHPVDEIPVLGTGKMNLKAVKDMALALARR